MASGHQYIGLYRPRVQGVKGRTEALIDYQNCPQSALIYQLTMGAPEHLYCFDSIELAIKLGAG